MAALSWPFVAEQGLHKYEQSVNHVPTPIAPIHAGCLTLTPNAFHDSLETITSFGSRLPECESRKSNGFDYACLGSPYICFERTNLVLKILNHVLNVTSSFKLIRRRIVNLRCDMIELTGKLVV